MSFTVVPLFWWEGEGFKPQFHISSHSFSIPSSWDHNFLHLMGSTIVFHLLSPFSCPYNTQCTSYTSEVWKQNFTHRQLASQNSIFSITSISK